MKERKIKPTISQVIYCLKAECERYPEVCEECQLYGEVGCDHCYDDVTDVAIKCLKELEQYRAIGTVEELKRMKENGAFSGVELAQICAMQMQLKEYKSIGTVEECRTAVERMKPRKVEDFSEAFQMYRCPNCDVLINNGGTAKGIHCKWCGQRFDWSE